MYQEQKQVSFKYFNNISYFCNYSLIEIYYRKQLLNFVFNVVLILCCLTLLTC